MPNCVPNPAKCFETPMFPNAKDRHAPFDETCIENEEIDNGHFCDDPATDGTFDENFQNSVRECSDTAIPFQASDCRCDAVTVPGASPFAAAALAFRLSIGFQTDWLI